MRPFAPILRRSTAVKRDAYCAQVAKQKAPSFARERTLIKRSTGAFSVPGPSIRNKQSPPTSGSPMHRSRAERIKREQRHLISASGRTATTGWRCATRQKPPDRAETTKKQRATNKCPALLRRRTKTTSQSSKWMRESATPAAEPKESVRPSPFSPTKCFFLLLCSD